MTFEEHAQLITRPGAVVCHFKRNICSDEEIAREPNIYLYKVIGIAEHTETGEKLVTYKALYGDLRIYARPYNMFVSPIDRERYPDYDATLYRLDIWDGPIAATENSVH